MFSFVLFGALLVVSSVNGFGGCGCRQEPPPCYQEPAPSCGQQEVCTPCPPPPPPPPCPMCPAPQIPQCPACPAPPQPPPCPACPPQQVCEVCEVCPPQIVPEPCPQCPAPPPPPQCPVCPAPQPPPPPQPCPGPPPPPRCGGGGYRRPRPQYHSNDCCNQCGGGCLFMSRLRMHGAATMVVDVDPTCNSEKLRTIILNNISADITESKRAIQKQAKEKLAAQFDVICAKGDFSYVISSNQFCQETKDDVTCYVFRA